MARRRVYDVQAGFGGGLNTTADASQLGPTEMRRAENARLTEYGGVTRRLGTQRVHVSAIAANPVRSGYAWIKSDGSVKELVACGGTVYSGTYAIPMTWTSTTGLVAESAYPAFAGFINAAGNDCAYIADGGLLNSWDGTTFSTDIVGSPSVQYLATYNMRLFGAGDTAHPQRLYFSSLSNGDTLGNASDPANLGGYADVRTFSNLPITGLVPIGGSLLIFMSNGIARFTGWSIDDIAINSGTQGIANDVGTIASRSIVTVENVAYFLSDRGIYEVSEFGVSPISVPIDATIRGLDQTKFNRVRSGHNKKYREVWFYLPDAGIYTYNYYLKAWTGPQTGVFNAQATITHSLWQTFDATSAPILLTGGEDGFVRRVDAPSTHLDDVVSAGTGGNAFTTAVQCRRFYFGDPTPEKSLRFLYVIADTRGSANASIGWTTGTASGSSALAADTSALWGGANWGIFSWGGLGSFGKRVHASGRGTFVDITLSDSGTAAGIYSRVEAQAFDMGRRY